MYILLSILHYLTCFFLIVVVLLQSGKSADLASTFGAMGSQTVFGPRGSATVLSKATTIAAALFMVTSLSLSILATRGGRGAPSLLDKAAKPAAAQPKAALAPGQTAPITVTPVQGGKAGQPQNIQVPVVPAPAQAPPQPAQK